MNGLQRLNYWERLRKLKLFSLERRRERYVIIFIWKVWNNLVLNPGIKPRSYEPKNGVFLYLPQLTKSKSKGSSHIRKLKENSIFYRGVQLFNSLPVDLRSNPAYAGDGPQSPQGTPSSVHDVPPSVDRFKTILDKYLLCLPDQPTIPNFSRSAASNSILDQKRYMKPYQPHTY